MSPDASHTLVRASIAAATASVLAAARPPQQRIVRHESDVVSSAKNEAMLSESAKMGTRRGDISGKVEEQLRRAALLHARTGDFKKYCSIMVELNEWAQVGRY